MLCVVVNGVACGGDGLKRGRRSKRVGRQKGTIIVLGIYRLLVLSSPCGFALALLCLFLRCHLLVTGRVVVDCKAHTIYIYYLVKWSTGWWVACGGGGHGTRTTHLGFH